VGDKYSSVKLTELAKAVAAADTLLDKSVVVAAVNMELATEDSEDDPAIEAAAFDTTARVGTPFATLEDELEKNRVHQRAIRSPLSNIRCLRIKKTTSKKNARAAIMSSLSIQSVFSSTVISCLEVPMRPVSTSWASVVDFSVAVDDSTRDYYQPSKKGKTIHIPSICVESTERSSSPCMSASVLRIASVTSFVALIKASSLQTLLTRLKYTQACKRTLFFPPKSAFLA
jgi:hypothetical protein